MPSEALVELAIAVLGTLLGLLLARRLGFGQFLGRQLSILHPF